jgi:CO/xanthine dehydrogenase Mo-binding subunit
MTAVGRSMRRLDGPEKLNGAIGYADDVTFKNLLHARLVLSPHAHARISSIERAAALGQPDVVAVLIADDLRMQLVDDLRKSQPLARDEVMWVGQPVAIVVAETDAAAADAAELVEVTYDPLPPVLDPSAAMASGAGRVRERIRGGGGASAAHGSAGGDDSPTADEVLSANVASQIHHRRGDVAQGFAEASVVVEGHVRTSAVHQSYMEPQTATAALDAQGTLTVWSSTQSVFYTRKELAASLGLPLRRVRLVAMPIGGGFGGKILLVEPLVAASALVLRRPVRLAFTRSEEFLAGNPANASEVWVKVGAREDGTLCALQGRVVMDAGAFPEWSPASLACLALGGYYRATHLEIDGYDVMTHRSGSGSYRAPGAPQATFAIETAMDELAERFGCDALELRLKNAVREGDPQRRGPSAFEKACRCSRMVRRWMWPT